MQPWQLLAPSCTSIDRYVGVHTVTSCPEAVVAVHFRTHITKKCMCQREHDSKSMSNRLTPYKKEKMTHSGIGFYCSQESCSRHFEIHQTSAVFYDDNFLDWKDRVCQTLKKAFFRCLDRWQVVWESIEICITLDGETSLCLSLDWLTNFAPSGFLALSSIESCGMIHVLYLSVCLEYDFETSYNLLVNCRFYFNGWKVLWFYLHVTSVEGLGSLYCTTKRTG
jgi:hypothetical protein